MRVVKKSGCLILLLSCLMVWIDLGYAHNLKPKQAGYKTPIYATGVQAYRQGDYKTSADSMRLVIAKDKTNVNAHYYLGLSLEKLGKPSQALTEYSYVAAQGHEPEVVAYAKRQIAVLRPSVKVTGVNMARNSNLVLMAAGNQLPAAVYRGAVSQVAVPLKNSKNALIVDALLSQGNSQSSGAFIIDTGATYTSISQEMAEQLDLDLENCETVLITTANGRIEVPKIMIQTLNVNGLEAHNIEATVIPVRHGASFSGLLGLSFIRQFVVTIDPQANQLIFRRN